MGRAVSRRAKAREQARGYGLKLSPANNDRLGGWSLVKEAVAAREDGRAGLVFFTTCRNAIRTLPTLVHDKTKVEDLDTDGEDHAADALRYGVARVLGKGQRAKTRVGADRGRTLAGSVYGRG